MPFRSLMQAVDGCGNSPADRCARPIDACQPLRDNSVECRFLINDARSEIDRLRRQLAGLESHLTVRFAAPPRDACEARPCDRSSLAVDLTVAKAARRAYAVTPIGEVRIEPLPVAAIAPRQPLQLHTVITNLGSLIDVLM